jgi:hypothetical protein
MISNFKFQNAKCIVQDTKGKKSEIWRIDEPGGILYRIF